MDLQELKKTFFKKINIISKIFEISLNLLVLLVCVVILSFVYFYLINKNTSVIIFYIGIIICILIGVKISKLFKTVNNNNEYKDIYENFINDPSITNYTSLFKNVFSKINISKTISKNNSKENSYLIMPNIFFIVICFCYLYFVLCFTFTMNLNNSNETPQVISFFMGMIVTYILIYTIYCSLKLFKIQKNTILKSKHFDFILKIGIYNLITSFILALIITFIYFNVIKTFSRKNLFFQNTKFCKKKDDGSELCYYEPKKANWGY